ncbi:MAG: flagellin [Pirellulales bacterium]
MRPITVGACATDQQLLQSFRRNSEKLETSLERLSTGKRINRPSDDPSGFVAAEGFRRDLTDLTAKLKAIGADRRQSRQQQSELGSLQSALASLRDRVLSANDSLLTQDQRSALRSEIDTAIDAVNRIVDQSATGAAHGIDPLTAEALQAGDASAADLVSAKSQSVAAQRTELVAHEHTHLDVFEQLYQDQIVITSEALSQVEDTDFAAETANFAQAQVLSQSAMAALQYASRTHVEQISQLLDETV